MDRVLIAGTHSGCGKTTVTLALLMALKAQSVQVSAFKCGPDFIDPMFHRRAIGVPCYNLDPYFCDEEQLRSLLAAHAGEISVIEGVMGYYDGVGPEGNYSTYDVARHTKTPVVLVIDVDGMYASAGAVLHGFLNYKPNSGICGVVFNGASAALYEGLKQIAEQAGITPLGFLPHAADCTLKSRHLGLVTPDEYADMQQKLLALGKLAQKYIDIAGIRALAERASEIKERPPQVSPVSRVRIAVARDEAFRFMYQENVELLEALGTQVVYFSPLCDAALPENISGLYLCGGYPELYGAALSSNEAMRRSIREVIEGGLPTIAECGGFLYLHDTLNGLPMAGVIHASAYNTGKLTRFGYAELTAQKHNLLCDAGGTIRAHEFHYYDSGDCGDGFYARKPAGNRAWACAHASDTLYAGFPHLYFYANPSFAERFIRKAAQYADSKLH